MDDERRALAIGEYLPQSLEGALGASAVPSLDAFRLSLPATWSDSFQATLAGLYDAAEENDFRRGLERAGLGSGLSRAGMERLGFYVCVEDLEDELIRALGTGRVEDLIEAEGESGPFLTFTRQPAHRDTARDQQLRRFMGTRSGRKIRYGHLLAAALDLTLIPAPLAGLLSAV